MRSALCRTDARQFIVDNARESLQWLCAGNQPAVDKESRRASYADTISFFNIFLDIGLILATIKAVFEASDVEPHLLSERFEDFRTGFGRSGKELVMVSPELSLFVGAPRRLMSFSRSRVKVLDRKITKEQLDFFAVFGLELRESGNHAPAKRAVKVRKFYYRDRGLRRSFKRRPVHRHLDPKDRWRLQVNYNLGLGAQ